MLTLLTITQEKDKQTHKIEKLKTFHPLNETPNKKQKTKHNNTNKQITQPNIKQFTTPEKFQPNNQQSYKHETPIQKQTINKIHKTPITTSKQLFTIINNNNIIPKTIPLEDDIGKLGLMWPRGIANMHDAAPLLHSYSDNGCPVNCGNNWTKDHIIASLKRGAHISAKGKEARQCLINETETKIKEGFAKKIKWKDIKNNIPPNLKISPIAMIPHKSRKYRAILDLSFQLRLNGKQMPSVNSATNKLAPQKAMAGLGEALRRFIFTMAHNYNKDQPFKFAKCDIKDGFWRMVVHQQDAWNFCYTIPPATKNTPLDDLEIVIPDSLQMGWCESPPLFCAATETARDVIQFLIENNLPEMTPHAMEKQMMQNNKLHIHTKPTKSATTITEVYVDDFCAGTNNLEYKHLLQLSRAILHGIHSIFPPTAITNHNGGDPISEKKMLAGDGTWSYQKEILGWILDGENFTIFLPPEKTKKIVKQIKTIANKSSCNLNDFQKMAGKLNHAAIGIPAGKGLFSPIYYTMRGDPKLIIITPQLKQALLDWCTLIQRLSTRPTIVMELVPSAPWYVSYVDAAGSGVGGVWISGTNIIKPYVWRMQWPADITKNIVSFSNPKGTITNSDLEMAGVLLAWLVLEQIAPKSLQFSTVGIFCDNTPAVSWSNRLQSSKSVVAGHLLRVLALRQHTHRSSPCLTVSIAGVLNIMADQASRSFEKAQYTNTNDSFLTVFSKTFPLQSNSWSEYHLNNKLFSRVTSCLRGKPLTMASWLAIPGQEKNIGLTGKPTQPTSSKNPISNHAPTTNPSSLLQPSLQGCGLATTATAVLSQFKPLETRYQPSQRPSNWLDFKAQSSKHKALTKSQWDGLWKDSNAKTPSQFPSSLYQLKYHKNVDEQEQHQAVPNSKPLGTSH